MQRLMIMEAAFISILLRAIKNGDVTHSAEMMTGLQRPLQQTMLSIAFGGGFDT